MGPRGQALTATTGAAYPHCDAEPQTAMVLIAHNQCLCLGLQQMKTLGARETSESHFTDYGRRWCITLCIFVHFG